VLKELNKLPDATAKLDIAIGAYAKYGRCHSTGGTRTQGDSKERQRRRRCLFGIAEEKPPDAYHAFGLTSRAELQQAAIAASANYQI
jgi:hypothetical protein